MISCWVVIICIGNIGVIPRRNRSLEDVWAFQRIIKLLKFFAWRWVFIEGCEVQKLANRPALYIELNAILSSGLKIARGLFHCALKDGSL